MATERNGDLPAPDLRNMEELCQPTLNGRGGPIAPIAIQATNFRLKNDMIQQVQNSCQFHGLPGDDANKHLDKFLHVTQSIKVNGVTDDALRLYLFPHSLTHHATAWFDRFPRNSINTFEQMAKMFLGKYIAPSMVTKLRNEITNFRQRPDESLFEAWERYKLSIDRSNVGQTQNIYAVGAYQGGSSYQPQGNHNLLSYRSDNYLGPPGHGQNPPLAYQASANQAPGYQALVHQPLIPQPQFVTTTEFTNYMKANDAILKNMQTNMTSLINSNLELKNMLGQFMKMNTASSSGSGTLPSNTISNPKEDLKGITTRSGNAYQGPTIPTTSYSPPQVVERETDVTKDTMHPTNNESTKDVQPPVVQIELQYQILSLLLLPSFPKTRKALIDVYEGELTLRVGKEAITFNLDQTSRYSANYNDMTANQIDVIDMAYEEYSQEGLGFFDVIASGNPTPYYDPIVSTSSPTLTPFGDSDFLLEEVDAFLALEDDPTSREVDHSYYDTEGDILLLEALLNDDPSLPPPNQ
nr:reverse transcriptase domain-containing protein [Tanacetum cinerariifolium]